MTKPWPMFSTGPEPSYNGSNANDHHSTESRRAALHRRHPWRNRLDTFARLQHRRGSHGMAILPQRRRRSTPALIPAYTGTRFVAGATRLVREAAPALTRNGALSNLARRAKGLQARS